MERGCVVALIPEGYADWEAGFACSEINKPDTGYTVTTMSIDCAPKRSIGGWSLVPDRTLDELPDDVRMLILVGGESWQDPHMAQVTRVIDACLERHVPVAAICGACTFLAEHGYLDACDHTGNADYEFAQLAPHYQGQARFLKQPVVDGGSIITANGAAGIEFACALCARLDVTPWGDVDTWRTVFKRGSFV